MGAKDTIDDLWANVKPFERKLLDEIWEVYSKQGEWLTTRELYSKFDTDVVQKALSKIGGNIVREDRNHEGRTVFRLTLLGILCTSDGKAFQDLLLKYFDYQRRVFRIEPRITKVKSVELAAALGLNPDQTAFLGRLISCGSLNGVANQETGSEWWADVMTEAEKFPKSGDLTLEVNKFVLKYYYPNAQVFEKDQPTSYLP